MQPVAYLDTQSSCCHQGGTSNQPGTDWKHSQCYRQNTGTCTAVSSAHRLATPTQPTIHTHAHTHTHTGPAIRSTLRGCRRPTTRTPQDTGQSRSTRPDPCELHSVQRGCHHMHRPRQTHGMAVGTVTRSPRSVSGPHHHTCTPNTHHRVHGAPPLTPNVPLAHWVLLYTQTHGPNDTTSRSLSATAHTRGN
jgi:hypothetical protein